MRYGPVMWYHPYHHFPMSRYVDHRLRLQPGARAMFTATEYAMPTTLYAQEHHATPWGDYDRVAEFFRENARRLNREDADAKTRNQLLGRVIHHPYADGYAVYQIVRETKRTCTVRVCQGLGDDWVLPAWGEQVVLSRTQVQDMLRQRDALAKLFERWKD